MNNRILNEISIKINMLDLKGRRIFIFGVNDYSSYIIYQLGELGITVERILDNDTEKEGICVEEVEVLLPEKYLHPIISDALILIASQHVKEMSKQLDMYGYTKENVVSILNLNSKRIGNHLWLDQLWQKINNARIGKQIINKIKEQHGENVYIL